MRSPIVWLGGKGRLISRLLPIINSISHKYYIEPFGGGASILLAKPPSNVETYNDLDSSLYNFFMTLKEPELFDEFYKRVSVLPYSRQLYHYGLGWQDEANPLEKVIRWYIVARQSFGGRFGSGWGYAVTETANGRAQTASKWQGALKRLPQIHKRLVNVQIENNDALKVLSSYDNEEALFYCDPPYVSDSRKAGGYSHELSDAQHITLIDALIKLRGSVIVSAYPNRIYEVLNEYGFVKITHQTSVNVAGRVRGSQMRGTGSAFKHGKRLEVIWVKTNIHKQRTLF